MIVDCHGHYTTAPPGPLGLAQAAGGREGRVTRTEPRISDDEIRDEPRKRAAEAAARARNRHHLLLAARRLHGAPRRRRRHQRAMGARAERPDPSRLHAVPEELRAGLHAAAVAGRLAGELRRRARALREGDGLHRLQPQPRSLGRLVEGGAAHRPLVVPALREDGRARRAGHGARQLLRATRPSTSRARTTSTPTPPPSCSSSRATSSRTSRTLKLVIPHGGGAVPYHWGRYRGLAPGHEAPAAEGPPAEERVLRHLRLPPAGHRPAAQGDPGGQHPVRLRDGRRGARHRPGDGPVLRRHEALHRRDPASSAADKQRIFEGNARKVYSRWRV